jgi:hypothetical protein
MRFFLSVAFLLFYFSGANVRAQVAGNIVSGGGHATSSTLNMITYSAQCPGAGYEIRFLKQSAQAQFIVKDGGSDGGERAYDISGTRFGKTFLHKRLYGEFEISCGKGLVLFFMGVQLQRTGAPKVVSYHISIDNNGTVLRDEGLWDEDPIEIDRLIDR